MRMPHLISHDSAAYLLGLPILEAEPRLVHVTRFGVLGSRTEHGVKHHKAPFRMDQILFSQTRPVLDIPRTVADIAREHGTATASSLTAARTCNAVLWKRDTCSKRASPR